MCSCWLFSLPLIFTLVAASISSFLKFLCFSSNEIGLLCFLSRSSSFAVIHVNVDIKIKLKYRIGFVVVVFNSKSQRKLCDLPQKRAGAWNVKFHPLLHEGVDVRKDAFLRTKISWMHRLPNFLTHGASLRTLRARELHWKLACGAYGLTLWFRIVAIYK